MGQVEHRPNDTVENKVAGAILKSAFMSSCAIAYPYVTRAIEHSLSDTGWFFRSCTSLKSGCCQCCDLYRNIDRVAEVQQKLL